jgi:hypothetical protein
VKLALFAGQIAGAERETERFAENPLTELALTPVPLGSKNNLLKEHRSLFQRFAVARCIRPPKTAVEAQAEE